jgi:hypothetical protein
MDALMSHPAQGNYTIGQIANALLTLAGRAPGSDPAPGVPVAAVPPTGQHG